MTNEPKHVLFMLLTATLHELGHIAALAFCKVKICTLVLGLFGGTLILEKKLISYPKEVAVALSGPLVNIFISIALFFVLRHGFDADIFFAFLSNASYGIFNLLPILGLDGGCALTALLSVKGDLYSSVRTVSIISRLTLFLMAAFSLYLVSLSAFNISLFVLTLLFYAESCEGHIISGYEFCRKTS
jgi:stage IV sporulation protein FB